MPKKRVLNIALQNKVTSYLNIAYPLIFLLSEPKLDHWVKERFIHIYSQCWFGNYLRTDYTDSSRYFGDLLERLAYTHAEARVIVQSLGMLDFIKDAVERGFAVNVFTLDLYHLPEAAEHRKEHRVHELFIYGYDDFRNRLEVIGFDRNGLFAAYSISYESFCESFAEALAAPPVHLKDAFHLIKKREIRFTYRFDLKSFRQELHKLTFSIPDPAKLFFSVADDSEATYGLAVYDLILEQMERRLEGKPSHIVNFTTVHFISEHSKLLEERFSFIDEIYRPKGRLQSLFSHYQEVRRQHEAMRNGYLRHAMKESGFESRYKIANEDAFESVYRMLKKTAEQEKELLSNVDDELTKLYA